MSEVDDNDYLETLSIRVNRIAISPRRKVARRWREQADGSFIWRKRIDHQWAIECHNAPPEQKAPIFALQGYRFWPHAHSVTLDDFVFLMDKRCYVHIATLSEFNARHINARIFRDRATWPLRLHHFDGRRIKPTSFIRRFNRVSSIIEMERAMQMISGLIVETPHAVA